MIKIGTLLENFYTDVFYVGETVDNAEYGRGRVKSIDLEFSCDANHSHANLEYEVVFDGRIIICGLDDLTKAKPG